MEAGELVFQCERGGYFLLRCFFIRVALIIIFNDKLSCVKKCNCTIVYSETPVGGDSCSRGDRSVEKQCGSIDRFLYGVPYSI